MQSGMQGAQAVGQVDRIEAVETERVRILPAVMRLVFNMLDNAVQFGIEQRAPRRVFGMLMHVIANAEHRQ